MDLLPQILLGIVLCAATVVVHGVCLFAPMQLASEPHTAPRSKRLADIYPRAFVLFLVIWLMLVHFFEGVLWAWVYWGFGTIENIDEAIYFSLSSYTTLGYGDIVLPENWRILGALQGTVGLLMFGWSTALLMPVISHQMARRRAK